MTDLTEIWIGAIVGTVPTYDPFTKKRTERNQKTDCVSSKRRIKIFLSGYPISFVPWRHATFLYRVELTHLAFPILHAQVNAHYYDPNESSNNFWFQENVICQMRIMGP